MALAIIVVAGLHVALPGKYRVNPAWVLPVLLLALLAALIIGDPGRIDRQKPWLRVTTDVMIAFITAANLFAAGRLVGDIVTVGGLFAANAPGAAGHRRGDLGHERNRVRPVVLGSGSRRRRRPRSPSGREPGVRIRGDAAHRLHASGLGAEVRRLPVAVVLKPFAFSPTDVSAIKPWAKLLMMTEAAVSLVIGVLVIARAVNILKLEARPLPAWGVTSPLPISGSCGG